MVWRWRSPRGQQCMGRPRTWRWRSPCAVKRGYTISHIYKLPVKVYPFYAPLFCMVDVLSRVIPQRMLSTNASPIAAPSHVKYIQWRANEIRVPLDLLEVMGLCRTLTREALVDLSWLSKTVLGHKAQELARHDMSPTTRVVWRYDQQELLTE